MNICFKAKVFGNNFDTDRKAQTIHTSNLPSITLNTISLARTLFLFTNAQLSLYLSSLKIL